MRSGSSSGRTSFGKSLPNTNAKTIYGYGLVDFRKTGFKGNKTKAVMGVIIALLVLASPVLIWMIPRAHVLVSHKDYSSVDNIIVDDGVFFNDNYNQEELYIILKDSWTRVPIIATGAEYTIEDFKQHHIKVTYTDGTEDDIYLYYNPYKSEDNGFAVSSYYEKWGEMKVISYDGYDKILEYIENSLG